jgi:hypothetical protein
MKALLASFAREPALVVAVVLALVNAVWTITADQSVQLQTVIEALLTLIAGGVIRSQVKPLNKLPPSMQGSADQSLPASARG